MSTLVVPRRQVRAIDKDLIEQALLDEQRARQGDDLVDRESSLAKVSGGGNGREDCLALPPLGDVEVLKLSFKCVQPISNLDGFDRLHTLCLDNNAIEKIEHLGHLVNLRWLDLSFNSIRTIEGLETLTKLTDLSLFNNKIETIERLEHCQALECLSLGNNRIKALESIMHLRALKALKVLNLQRNPVCKDPEYKAFVLAYLDPLVFLDYCVVNLKERAAAKEQYQDALTDIQEKEAVVKHSMHTNEPVHPLDGEQTGFKWTEAGSPVREEKERKRDDRPFGPGRHAVATEGLLTELLKEEPSDSSMQVTLVPGMSGLLSSFREQYTLERSSYLTKVTERSKRIQEAMQEFQQQKENLDTGLQEKSIALVRQFEKLKQQKNQAAIKKDSEGQGRVSRRPETTLSYLSLLNSLDTLRSTLFDIEIYRTDQAERLIEGLAAAFSKFKDEGLQDLQQFFRAIESAVDKLYEGQKQSAIDSCDAFARGEMNEAEMQPQVTDLLKDKPLLLSSLLSSHDYRVGLLLTAEEDARNQEMDWFEQVLIGRREDEYARNRTAVSDITWQYDTLKAETVEMARLVEGEEGKERAKEDERVLNKGEHRVGGIGSPSPSSLASSSPPWQESAHRQAELVG